ncbi:hypothetical protein BC937DRAFT_89905 [Endogone sp. FLAS-F59071]|nr:hypothetical protein BC937DRAFT_89905 [Endogone sp. FLAS-F59071]|eukprot:RUS22246.1 hypothetical protein BC937DRAFT_89905 [Endogone sp. FLAS-F59071]
MAPFFRLSVFALIVATLLHQASAALCKYDTKCTATLTESCNLDELTSCINSIKDSCNGEHGGLNKVSSTSCSCFGQFSTTQVNKLVSKLISLNENGNSKKGCHGGYVTCDNGIQSPPSFSYSC